MIEYGTGYNPGEEVQADFFYGSVTSVEEIELPDEKPSTIKRVTINYQSSMNPFEGVYEPVELNIKGELDPRIAEKIHPREIVSGTAVFDPTDGLWVTRLDIVGDMTPKVEYSLRELKKQHEARVQQRERDMKKLPTDGPSLSYRSFM